MKKNHTLLLSTLILVLTTFHLKSTTYFYQGGAITTLSSWNTALNGSGSAATTFTGSHTWNFHNNTTTATLNTSWGISANAIVNIGDATNAFSLTLNTGASIGTSNTQINIRNNGTLIDNMAYAFNVSKTNPNTGSTMVFASNSAQILAFVNSYYNVVIDADVNLNAVNITINGTLTINSGKTLTLNNLNLIINGKIAGSGEIIGDNGGASGIAFNTATGDVGTLRFQTGSQVISNLNINLGSSTSSLTLGTNLVIDGGTIEFNAGSLALNGHSLQVASGGAIDFSGGGTVIGTNASALEIDGSITGSLNMESTNNILAGLTLNSTGNTLTLGNALTITDSVLVTAGTLASGGNLTLNSDATRAARIASVGASGSISGNITVQSFFPAGSSGWVQMGVNGVNGQTIANLDGQIPMTCQGCSNGVALGSSYFESIQGWEEAVCGYDTTLTSSSAMSPGKGFWVYLGSSASTSTNMTWSFTGFAVQGATAVAVTANFGCGTNDNRNLVSNPYPSPISCEKLLALASNVGNFDGTIELWSRNNVSAADYNTGLHTGTGGGTDILQAGQGFFVQANANTNLNFSESVKTNGGTTSLLRAASSSTVNLLRLRVTGQYDTDDAAFVICSFCSVNKDKYDSKKRFSSPGYSGKGGYSNYTSISSLDPQSGVYMSINGFPATNYSLAIPVLVKVSTTGSYTITADEFQNYGSCAVIRDKLTNIYTDLKIKPYVFNISDTTNTPRFELIVCESGGSGVSLKEIYASSNISIGQDKSGPVVKTNFAVPTDAVISVYNILGQQLAGDIKVSGTETTTRLDYLNLHHQVVLIKVTADNQSVTKKLLVE